MTFDDLVSRKQVLRKIQS